MLLNYFFPILILFSGQFPKQPTTFELEFDSIADLDIYSGSIPRDIWSANLELIVEQMNSSVLFMCGLDRQEMFKYIKDFNYGDKQENRLRIGFVVKQDGTMTGIRSDVDSINGGLFSRFYFSSRQVEKFTPLIDCNGRRINYLMTLAIEKNVCDVKITYRLTECSKSSEQTD